MFCSKSQRCRSSVGPLSPYGTIEGLSVPPPPLTGLGEPRGKTEFATGSGTEAGEGRASLLLPGPG